MRSHTRKETDRDGRTQSRRWKVRRGFTRPACGRRWLRWLSVQKLWAPVTALTLATALAGPVARVRSHGRLAVPNREARGPTLDGVTTHRPVMAPDRPASSRGGDGRG